MRNKSILDRILSMLSSRRSSSASIAASSASSAASPATSLARMAPALSKRGGLSSHPYDQARTICRGLQVDRVHWSASQRSPQPPATGFHAPCSHRSPRAFSTRASHSEPTYDDDLDYDTSPAPGGMSKAEEKLLLGLKQRQIKLPYERIKPGSQIRMVCPICQGGSSREASLSITIEEGFKGAVWHCFRGSCGWKGRANPEGTRNMSFGSPRPRSPSSSNSDASDAPGPAPRRPAKNAPPVLPVCDPSTPLSQTQRNWLNSRGITDEVIEANSLFADRGREGEGVFVPMLQDSVEEVLCFPYMKDGKLVNIKYRALPKHFWQYRGAEKVVFGYDQVFSAWAKQDREWAEQQARKGMDGERADFKRVLIVVEGEMDKLALNAAGVYNVVSVPDGAPSKVKEGELPPADQDKKYSYLWACKDLFDQADSIVLATDADEPGRALAEELARRLGRERCFRVHWPDKGVDVRAATQKERELQELESRLALLRSDPEMSDGIAALEARRLNISQRDVEGGARKDANDVLLKDGADRLVECIQLAEPYPVKGLYRFMDFRQEVEDYYNQVKGMELGMSTGWGSVDQYYRVVPGELTVITGVPNSGKSEWLDALLVNLSTLHGWSFALCSMEKRVQDHARQLLEKHVGRPFFTNAGYARNFQRMSEAEMREGMEWIDDRFHVIRSDDDQLPTIDWVLEKARLAVYRHGIRGLVIDPYNELDHSRNRDVTETEYVSQLLSKLKRFAQHHDAHVWFVAHPRQLKDWRGGAPNLYDISGSAHFINKCDNGIVIHRNRDKDLPLEERRKVEVMVRKVRNKAAGTIGDAVLLYEFVSGRYEDPGLQLNPPPYSRNDQQQERRGAGGNKKNARGPAEDSTHDGAEGVMGTRMQSFSNGMETGSGPSGSPPPPAQKSFVTQSTVNGMQITKKAAENPVTGKPSSLPADAFDDLDV